MPFKFNPFTGTLDIIGNPGAENFTDLLDVPNSYTGQANKQVRVNASEDGLEFVAGTGNTISIGDEVVGGNPGDYLTVDGSGNLSQTTLDTNYLPLSGGTMTGGIVMGGNFLTFDEIAAPSSPGADQIVLYATDDGGVTKMAVKDSAGSVTILGSGGSGAVDSVFGRTGAVVATTNDYTWAQIDKTTSDIADITTKSHTSLTDIGTNTHAQIDTHIADTSNPHSVTAAQAGAVALTGDESVAGIKTLTSFPILPSTNPTTDYQAAHKKYVDDLVASGITWKAPVLEVNQNTPPGSPTTGDRYTLGNSPTGAWAGQADKVAEWNGSSWDFETPSQGWAVLNLTDEIGYTYDGATWVAFSSVGVLTGSNGISVVGQDARLGGTLTGSTTITQGAYNFIFNLDGAGDFAIQDSGVAAFQVDDSGFTRIGSAITNLGQLAIQPTDATRRGLVIRGAASQTGQLFLLENSAGTDLAAWSASGKFTSALTSVDDTTTQFNLSQTALIHQQQSNTGSWFALTSQYAAVKFTAASAFYIYTVAAYLRASGTVSNPTATITAYIYSDNAGVPGTNLDTGQAIRVGSVTTSASGAKYQFGAFTTTTTAAADYWLVLRFSAVPAGADIEWQGAATGTNIFATSSDGSSWTPSSSISPRYTLEGRTGIGLAVNSPNNVAGSFTSINSTALSTNSTNGTGISATSVNGTGMSASSTYGNAIVGSSSFGIGISGTTTSGDAIRGTSTTGRGIYSTTTSGVALTAISTTGISASFSTTSGVGMIVTANPATTNTVHEMMRITRNTSGTAANGIGSRLSFYLEDGVGSSQLSGGFDFILTDVTNGAEDSAIALFTRNNGTVAERARLDNTGKFNAVQLESTTTTGTAPFVVASTTVSTNLNADLLDGNHASAFQLAGNYITALTGDVTASGPGSAAATLATVNANVGSFGSGSQVATFTVNAKGLITAASNTTIAVGISNITMNTGKLLGRTTASTGAVEEITPDSGNFTFTGGALNTIQDIDTSATPTFGGLYSSSNLYVQPGTTFYTNDIEVLLIGEDSGVAWDGTPLSMYWSNVDTGNGRLEFRTQGGTYYNIAANAFAGDGSQLTGLNASNVTYGVIGLNYGGTGTNLADPNADRIFFWDESANASTWLAMGNSVAITGTTLDTIQDIRTSASPTFVTVTASTSLRTPLLTTASGDLLIQAGGGSYIGYGGANIGIAPHEFYGSINVDTNILAGGTITGGAIISSGIINAAGSANTYLWIGRSSSTINETVIPYAGLIEHARTGNDTSSSSLTYYGTRSVASNTGTYNPGTSGQTRSTYGVHSTSSDTGNSGTGTPHTKDVYGGYFSGTNTGSVTSGTGLRNTYGVYGIATGDTNGTSVAYGVYGTAASADTNWAGYFNGNTYVNDALGVGSTSFTSGVSRVISSRTISTANLGGIINQFSLSRSANDSLNEDGVENFILYLTKTDSGTLTANGGYAQRTTFGIYNSLSDSGATIDDSAVNADKAIYGNYNTVSLSGNVTSGLSNRIAYAGYFSAFGSANGTSTGYGIYTTASGSDTNWALYSASGNNYFGGLVGVGISPTSRFHVSTTTASQVAATIVSNITSGATADGLVIDYDTNFLTSGNALEILYDNTSTSFGGSSTVFNLDANCSGNAMSFIGFNMTITQSGGSGATAAGGLVVVDDCSATATGWGATINNANVSSGAAIYGSTVTSSAAAVNTSDKIAVYGAGRSYFTLHTAYNTVSVDADNIATFLYAASTSDQAEISVISGTAGKSWVNLGDTGDEDIGAIEYDQTSNYMALWTNAGEGVRLSSTNQLSINTTAFTSGFNLKVNGQGHIYTGSTGSPQTYSTLHLAETDDPCLVLEDVGNGVGYVYQDGAITGFGAETSFQWKTGVTFGSGPFSTGTERMSMSASALVVNDAGNNFDVRMEGDTNANTFFLDASVDRVGINNGAPSYTLDVTGYVRASSAIITSDGNNGFELTVNGEIRTGDATGGPSMFFRSSGTNYYINYTGGV